MLSKINLIKCLLLCSGLFFLSCRSDDDPDVDDKKDLTVSFTGLENLGDDYVYEGWLIKSGVASSAGIFTVNDEGTLSKSTFSLDKDKVENAEMYVLTIEPSNDSDANPSKVHVLAGAFSNNDATLSIDHESALGNDFSEAAGSYILATPSDGMNTNEKSGVWFLSVMDSAVASLTLPTLPEGWKYEGWAVIGGVPVSTGTFTKAAGADSGEPFKGDGDTPPFPGEDFLTNAPDGLTFPTDLAGKTAVISIEPYPDNSPKPFTLKPLLGAIASDATDHTSYDLTNNIANTKITGTAKR